MKRLGYKKSRTGCRRCKLRRVKCNEAVPCSACIMHRLPCSLQSPDPQEASSVPNYIKSDPSPEPSQTRRDASLPSSHASSSRSSTASKTLCHDTTDPVPHFPRFLDEIQHTKPRDWASDLELMHHYTAVAYRTFSFWEDVRQALQYDVPREGLAHSFLLQQVLAFSGFHLAYLHPDRRNSYLVQASLYQDQAVVGINSALIVGVTSANCHALYASSIFLLICAFATYPSCEIHHKSFSPLESLIGIFCLMDGISLILNSSEEDLRNGPLQGLFAGKSGSIKPSEHIQLLVDQIYVLKQHLLELCSNRDEFDGGVILEAANSLAESLLSVHKKNSFAASVELRAAFLWPLRIPKSFSTSSDSESHWLWWYWPTIAFCYSMQRQLAGSSRGGRRLS